MKNKHLPDTTGIVLAGGKSSRFGQDKGLAIFQGKPLVMHAMGILQPLCSEILISTNQADAYQFTGMPLIADTYKNCGPLGGIHSGLQQANNQHILFLGCDMPLVPGELLGLLLGKLPAFQAAVARHNGFSETLCLAMKKEVLQQAILAINQKNYRILDLLQMIHTAFVEVSDLPFYDKLIFSNINSWNDLLEIEKPPS